MPWESARTAQVNRSGTPVLIHPVRDDLITGLPARWLDMCQARLARENIAAGTARRHSEVPAEQAAERSS